MNFASSQYLIFFTLVFIVYWSLSRRQQNLLILGASYFFYANWDWRFLGLIFVATVVAFVTGSKCHQARSISRKRVWLVVSLVVNLGILGYFKYFNFFAESLVSLGQAVGWTISHTTVRIILPVGISFFTFQTLSYTIDIYKGKLKPWHSFLDYAHCVTFFPQLVESLNEYLGTEVQVRITGHADSPGEIRQVPFHHLPDLAGKYQQVMIQCFRLKYLKGIGYLI